MSKVETDQTSCADKLKVLADSTRLAIVHSLMEQGPQYVNQLNENIDVDQSLLSHHLRTLRESGLVVANRDGKAVLYELAPGVKKATKSQNGIQLGCCILTFDKD